MPNIKSQIKRVKTNNAENVINTAKRTRVKHSIKAYNNAIAEKNIAVAEELLKDVISLIDRAKYDGIYHPSTASRKISRLSKSLSDIKKA